MSRRRRNVVLYAVVLSAGLSTAAHSTAAADLAADVTVDRASIANGQQVTLTATFANRGTSPAARWRAMITAETASGFPRGVQLAGPAIVTPPAGSTVACEPDLSGGLQCTGRGLPPGETATIVTTWSSDRVASPVMTATVLSDRVRGSNDRADVLVQVNPPAGEPNLEVTAVRPAVTWRRSVPRGAVVVAATTTMAARVEVALLQRGRVIVRRLADVPAGPFAVALKAPRGLLPGPHVLRVLDRGGLQVGSPVLPARGIALDLSGPRGGIADSAFISGVANGPAADVLPRRPRLFASFHLAILPRPGTKLRTAWFFGPRRVDQPRSRPRSANVGAFIEAAGGGLLPAGRYRCDLMAGTAVIASARVTLR